MLKVTHVEPSHGLWHGKHWSTAMRPSHRMTQLLRCNPYLRLLKKMEGRKGIEGKAHSMVIGSD